MDWTEESQKAQEFILAGLCGGAITGLFAGVEDRRVKGLLGVGLPVILDAAGTNQLKYLTDGQLHSFQERCLAKLTKPNA